MAHPPHHPDTGPDPGGASSDGAPRWVSVAGILIAIGVVLLIVVLHLTGVIGPGAHQ